MLALPPEVAIVTAQQRANPPDRFEAYAYWRRAAFLVSSFSASGTGRKKSTWNASWEAASSGEADSIWLYLFLTVPAKAEPLLPDELCFLAGWLIGAASEQIWRPNEKLYIGTQEGEFQSRGD